MTTTTITYPLAGVSNNDADFRRLVLEYSALLAAAGLVKTGDTGQIDASTVTRPVAANVRAGYEIWRFNDPLQASAPIYLKVSYGVGTGSLTNTKVWVALGQGSDGAGNLTGILSSDIANDGSDFGAVLGGSISYACHADGFFGVVNRQGGHNSTAACSWGSFAVCRSCDSNGYPTTEGVFIIFGGQSGIAQAINFDPVIGVLGAASTQVFQLPLGIGVAVAGEIPMYPLWMPLPHLVPVFGMLAYPNGLVLGNGVITIAMVGSRERTYLVPRKGFSGTANAVGFGMLWE